MKKIAVLFLLLSAVSPAFSQIKIDEVGGVLVYKKGNGPTKPVGATNTSQLTNGAGFQTAAQVSAAIAGKVDASTLSTVVATQGTKDAGQDTGISSLSTSVTGLQTSKADATTLSAALATQSTRDAGQDAAIGAKLPGSFSVTQAGVDAAQDVSIGAKLPGSFSVAQSATDAAQDTKTTSISANASAANTAAASANAGVAALTLSKLETLTTVAALTSYSGSATKVYLTTINKLLTYNSASTAGVDNGSIFAATGKGSGRWENLPAEITYLIDFLPPLDGVTDAGPTIQKAVNAAKGGILIFPKGATFRYSPVYLPTEITIDGNGSTIKPYRASIINGSLLFSTNAGRTSVTTGLYTGTPTTATPTAPKVFKNITIKNFNVDLEYTRIRFFGTDNLIDNSFHQNIQITDNKIRNVGAGNAITLGGANPITATSAVCSDLLVERNTITNCGAMMGLVMSASYATGVTSLTVQTFDRSESIAEKLQPGFFFQIATTKITGIDASTWATTATVYQVTGWTLDANDPAKSVIQIASGNYNSSTGWTADATNQGIRSSVAKGAWIIPSYSFELPMVHSMAKYTGASGSTTLTRSDLSATEDAYVRTQMAGQQFMFPSGQAFGVYTIVSVNGDNTMTITPALSSAVTGQRLLRCAGMSAAIALTGDCRNVSIRRNAVSYASHAVQVIGVNGKDYTWEDLPNTLDFTDNRVSYTWMGVELIAQNLIHLPNSALNVQTLTAGQTTITLTTPASFTVHSKDVNADGVEELLLTASSITLANATASNAWMVGDRLNFNAVRGTYIITAISADLTASPTVTISRYDPILRLPIAGGIVHGASNVDICYRNYSTELGSVGGYKRLTFTKNVFTENLRAGLGYPISVLAGEVVIEDNDFDLTERTALELSGYKIRVKKNRVKQKVFVAGSIGAVGQVNTGTGPNKRGYGAIMLLAGGDVIISENEFEGRSPDDGTFSDQVGRIFIQSRSYTPYDNSQLVINNNRFLGSGGLILAANVTKTISSTAFPTMHYDQQEFSNNKVTLRAPHTGQLLQPFSGDIQVRNNNIQYPGATTLTLFQTAPNPEQWGVGPWPITISNNRFSHTVGYGPPTLITGSNISSQNNEIK